ncbi:YdcF family protein [Ramlibacter pallidus]|uniref:YdcF family protein n=1 Tax=Ramlibacter pallidus TaxID=2780087 RepID=A0ABR9S8S8_9BURK|nr:YdcF family protein [Ramlibacter pallidus]MBE7369903.1 YdcF family protein [Ramlibacter pallidus]
MRTGWRIGIAVLVLVTIASAGVLVSATRAGAALLLSALEQASAPVEPGRLAGQVDAIVVVGGRTARVHHAARLHLATGLPVLLSGKGTGDSGFRAESEKMEDILLRQYGVGPRWVETESVNTHQNAVYSWCLVAGMGVRRIALVTDPYHMPRARAEFAAAGFEVVPAPVPGGTDPGGRPPFRWSLEAFRPGKAGWQAARRPLLEWGGAMRAALAGTVPFRAPSCP